MEPAVALVVVFVDIDVTDEGEIKGDVADIGVPACGAELGGVWDGDAGGGI